MYTKIEFRNSDIIFTPTRHRSSEHTKYGLHRYDVRHTDDTWDPYSIEDGVLVNHYGSILSKDKLDLDIPTWNKQGMIELSDDEMFEFMNDYGGVETIEDYVDLVGPFEFKIFLGIPTINIDGETYTIGVFDRNDFVRSNPTKSYIVNSVALPFRGEMSNYVGKILNPGIYTHHEHLMLILPLEDMTEYSINNIKSQGEE